MTKISQILTVIGAVFVTALSAQTINITGTVVDSATSQPIGGATVRLVDIPAVTAQTNSTGRFTLAGAVATIDLHNAKGLRAQIVVNRTGLFLSGLTRSSLVVVDLFNTAGARVLHSERRVAQSGTASFTDLPTASGMYFGRAMLSDDRRLAKFVMTTTRSSRRSPRT